MIFTGYYSQCEKNKRPAAKLADLYFSNIPLVTPLRSG